MNQDQEVENDNTLWRALIDSSKALNEARMNFLLNCKDKISVLRQALRDPSQRRAALEMLLYMQLGERQELFDDLVNMVDYFHSDLDLARNALLSLPREWVVSNIEKSAEPLLQDGDASVYRRFLELYSDLDRDLTNKLATRALQSDDEDTRTAGEDAMEWMKNE